MQCELNGASAIVYWQTVSICGEIAGQRFHPIHSLCFMDKCVMH